MSVTPADLLAYAKTLVATDEATCRNAAGRSYYAAYHAADNWHEVLPMHGVCPSGLGVHASLIECLKNPSIGGPDRIKSIALGYLLDMVKQTRSWADYNLGKDFPPSEVAQAIANSQKILEKV